jgi:hypothetical protein
MQPLTTATPIKNSSGPPWASIGVKVISALVKRAPSLRLNNFHGSFERLRTPSKTVRSG